MTLASPVIKAQGMATVCSQCRQSAGILFCFYEQAMQYGAEKESDLELDHFNFISDLVLYWI